VALLRGCGDIHEAEQQTDDSLQTSAALTDVPKDTAAEGTDGERKRALIELNVNFIRASAQVRIRGKVKKLVTSFMPSC
jgi:hypothetical protein